MHWLARRLQIFGVHIHVGVRSGDKAIPMVNALTYYVPHFLGLSPSSPYWMGRDTGLASCRSKVFEGLPTAGLPYQLSGWDEFEGFMASLISARTIQRIREVWWDVRPHPGFGTVEFRVCHGIPMLSEVAAVGAVPVPGEHLDALLDRDGKLAIPHEWVVRENKWRAARHGLKAQIIDDDHGELIPLRQSIANLVSELTPIAERLHCSDELARVLAILDRGPSYRATTRGGGCQQPPGRGRLDGRRTLRNDQLAARPPA